MDDPTWLIENVERVSVAGLLAFALLCLYKEWIVLGSTHRREIDECKKENEELKSDVKRYIEEDAREKAELRQEVTLLRQHPPRRRS